MRANRNTPDEARHRGLREKRVEMSPSLILLALLLTVISVSANRQRRYLVYPDGGPARTQFIIGLGIPVDLKEQAVTVGTVIKFQYDLPSNSTEYTDRIYGFVNTVSRDMNGNEVVDEDGPSNNENEEEEATETPDRDEDTLVDINFERERRRRYISYKDGGHRNSLDSSTEVPLSEAIRRQEMIDAKFAAEENDDPKRGNRFDFYKMIEHMTETYGFTGRPCMLRTICEAAAVPFTHENGLLGEIGHILFTPSSTRDELSHHTDNEYHAAERLGRGAADCERMFPECESSVLDTFTQIGVDTLHKFGL